MHNKNRCGNIKTNKCSFTLQTVGGEWIFRKILNGMGIEDLFICPSRATRESNTQADGEYGVALRMFNLKECHYDMVYNCGKGMRRLVFEKIDDKLIGALLDEPNKRWVFSEITRNTFHWQNVTVLENGEWKINSNVYAKRR